MLHWKSPSNAFSEFVFQPQYERFVFCNFGLVLRRSFEPCTFFTPQETDHFTRPKTRLLLLACSSPRRKHCNSFGIRCKDVSGALHFLSAPCAQVQCILWVVHGNFVHHQQMPFLHSLFRAGLVCAPWEVISSWPCFRFWGCPTGNDKMSRGRHGLSIRSSF